MFEQLRRTKHFGWLAYVVEWVTPLLVAVTFSWVAITSFQHADQLKEEAHVAQVQACAAVKGSNDATLDFLTKRVRSNPKVDTPDAESFLTDLANTYSTAERKCLVHP